MEEVAISVQKVNKAFKLPHEKHTSIKSLFINVLRGRRIYEKQQVLKNVSFEIKKGEFFGIVGRNGSGKSTLLKLLAGIYSSDSGHIEVNGRLTPFIELGVGFNPELTGRENVYLNGALLGFGTKEMDEMYDEIVSFAELEKFMDQKLKNYSSGMQVRLAFSIAIRAKSDILVLDEVLAVGDVNFQEKCIRQFKQFKKEGLTVVLVTHDMDTVEKFCDRTMLISKGKIVYIGDPARAIDRYEALNLEKDGEDVVKKKNSQIIHINNVDILDSNDQPCKIIDAGGDIAVSMKINSKKAIKDVFIAMRICESENQFPVAGFDTNKSSVRVSLKKGDNTIKVRISNSPLVRGKYYVVVGIYDSINREVNYSHYNGLLHDNRFLIKNSNRDVGIIEATTEWIL